MRRLLCLLALFAAGCAPGNEHRNWSHVLDVDDVAESYDSHDVGSGSDDGGTPGGSDDGGTPGYSDDGGTPGYSDDGGTPGDSDDGGTPGDSDSVDIPVSGSHPLHATPNVKACHPVTCEPMDSCRAVESAPPCSGAALEYWCSCKAYAHGEDWAAAVEAQIEAAATVAGGFLESQKAALRCLGYTEPSVAFKVQALPDTGVPSSITLNLLHVDLPGDAPTAAAAFLDRFGGLIGAALHLTPDYTLQTKPVDSCPELSMLPIDVVVWATAYKGNPLPGGSVEVMRTSLQRIQAYPEPGSCPGLYMIEKITSRMERRLE